MNPLDESILGPVEKIGGVPFRGIGTTDWARCELCGTEVDVGGEIRLHIEMHQERQRERDGR